MSNLLSRIEKISRGSPAPIGFGAASRAAQSPAMAIVGLLTPKSRRKAKTLADLDADGALLVDITADKALDSISNSLRSVPWGVKADELDSKAAAALIKKGCDFFFVTPDNVTVEAARDDRAAFILSLPADPGDGLLRALEDIPVNAAFLSLADGPLTLQRLIDVASVRAMFDKYLFVQVPAATSSRELEALRDVGVDALVIDMATTTKKSLTALKKRLTELPRQRKPRSERTSAVLPAGLTGGNADYDHEDE